MIAGAPGLLAAPAVLIPGRARGACLLVVADSGGVIGAAKRQAVHTPFIRETGVEIVALVGPDLARIRAQVRSRDGEGDVTDRLDGWVLAASRLDLLERLDEHVVDRTRCLPKARHDHAVAGNLHTGGIAYPTDRLAGKVPGTWPESWDTVRLSGRRALRNRVTDTFKIAFMGDGVPANEVYSAFTALVEGVCTSVARQGFQRFVILDAHGGNLEALRSITRSLTPKLNVDIVQLTYWLTVPDVVAAHLTRQKAVGHAFEAETSKVMASRPEFVAAGAIPGTEANSTGSTEALLHGLSRLRTMVASTTTGVLGNPEAATVENGLRLLEAIPRRFTNRLADSALRAVSWRASNQNTACHQAGENDHGRT